MARRIGFQDKDRPAAGAERRGRVLLVSVVLCVMGGIGGALALSALGDGNAIGFAAGAIWCVALVSWGVGKLVKSLLGLDRPRRSEGRHEWTLGGDDR